MRKVTLLCCLIMCAVYSQNKQVLYGFSEIPQSLLLNPGAKVSNDWYFGIPLLSHIHVNAGISGSTVYDIFADNNTNFNIKLQDAIFAMDDNDFYTFNQQLDIFSGGFAFGKKRGKNQYLSFGLYQELDFIAYFPKDLAVLALEGNQSNINRVFKTDQINASAEVVSVLHVGYNKKVSKYFTYGFRGKLYSNVFNVNSTKNDGYFITRTGDNNFYNHVFDLDLQVRTSGLASLADSDSDFETKDITKRLLFGENMGLGIDAGFTYQFNDQWYLDASVLDLGFINHKKDVENYSVKGEYAFEGVNPLFPETGDRQTANEYWSELENDLEDLFTGDTTTTKFTTWRPTKINASLNYAFGEKGDNYSCNCVKEESGYLNRVGMQLFIVNRPKLPQFALTAYYHRRLLKGLSVKATYTIDAYSLNNIGFGMYTNLGGFNFYVMADNFLQYENIYDAQSVSLQLGFNYIFNKNED